MVGIPHDIFRKMMRQIDLSPGMRIQRNTSKYISSLLELIAERALRSVCRQANTNGKDVTQARMLRAIKIRLPLALRKHFKPNAPTQRVVVHSRTVSFLFKRAPCKGKRLTTAAKKVVANAIDYLMGEILEVAWVHAARAERNTIKMVDARQGIIEDSDLRALFKRASSAN